MKKITFFIIFCSLNLYGSKFISDFWQFPIFPKLYSLGMPSTFSESIEAINVNPAGILSKKTQIYLSHTEYFVSFRSEVVGVSTFLKNNATQFAFIFNYIYALPFQETMISDNNYFKIGEFSVYFLLPILGFSLEFDKNINLGASLKYNYSKVCSEIIDSLLFDFGFTLKNIFNVFDVGISLQNIEFIKKYFFEKQFNFGIKWKVKKIINLYNNFQYMSKSNEYKTSIGVLFFIIKNFNINLGYKYGIKSAEPDKFICGTGYNLLVEKFNINFNWAGSFNNYLGWINILSIELNF